MRVAVTGGMGFIGTEVVSLLQQQGLDVIVVDFWERALRSYEGSRFPILERTYQNLSAAADVIGPDEFVTQLQTLAPDVIIHLGAVVDTMDMMSDDMVKQNVVYTRSLVSAANDGRPTEDIPGIILASSAATYGADFLKPNNPYGLTKSWAEKIVGAGRGNAASLRFFNVFGALEHHKGKMASLPFKLSQAYMDGTRFDMFSPHSSRDFIPVSAVARVVCTLVQVVSSNKATPTRSTFDVGTGKSTTLIDLDNFVMQATGNVSSVIREVPIPGVLAGRYQNFTCAGLGPNPVPVLGNDSDTRTGIQEQYGR